MANNKMSSSEEFFQTLELVKNTYKCDQCKYVNMCYDGEVCLYYTDQSKRRTPDGTNRVLRKIEKLREGGILTYEQYMQYQQNKPKRDWVGNNG